MNNDEATSIVRQELLKYRSRPYAELSGLVGLPIPTVVVKGAAGTEYQLTVQVIWDSQANGALRVVGSIDAGGWRAFVPLSEDFIVHHDDVISATW